MTVVIAERSSSRCPAIAASIARTPRCPVLRCRAAPAADNPAGPAVSRHGAVSVSPSSQFRAPPASRPGAARTLRVVVFGRSGLWIRAGSTVSCGVAHGPVADVPCFDVRAVGLAGETAWGWLRRFRRMVGSASRSPSPIGPGPWGPVVPGVSPGRGGYPSGSHLQCTPAGGRFSLGGGSAGRCRFTPGRRRGPDAPTSVGRVPRVEAFPGLVRQRLAVVGMSVVRPVASGAGLHQS